MKFTGWQAIFILCCERNTPTPKMVGEYSVFVLYNEKEVPF
jgi:hypothetical protein